MASVKLYSWNVNGIRAVTRKGVFTPFVTEHQPDILCLQETKAERGQAEIDLPDYKEYWNSAEKKGYSGTAIFSRKKPLRVSNGFSDVVSSKYDFIDDQTRDVASEGRVITAEYERFYVVTVYTPNAKDDLSRIPLRYQHWDPAFLEYCQALESGAIHLDEMRGADEKRSESYIKYDERASESATMQLANSGSRVTGSAGKQADTVNRPGKPVIFCGDLNVAHTPDDLARPKENVGKKGFTDEERKGFDNFIKAGFVDTFRLFHQGSGYYTWWSYMAKARERNVGWRIDYILVSSALKDSVESANIHPDVMGSDHCPVSITIKI